MLRTDEKKNGMRYIKILTILIGFISFPLFLLSCNRNITTADSSKSSVPSFSAAAMNRDILYHVNEYRKRKGLVALKSVDVADEQAAIHSKNMALKKAAFSHDGFEQRIAVVSKTIGTVMGAAENLAYGELSAEAVVKGWINSPGHKKNIEGNYTLTGIGTYQDGKGVIYFTQLFMRQ